jgi:L-rhamnose mutarotase
MKRQGFLFRIRPELKTQFKKDHDTIWPDMLQAIREAGYRNYSLFFRPDGTVFGYFECDDAAQAALYMSKTEVSPRWQRLMEKYFVKNDSSAPGPEAEDLEEVFHID